MTETEQTTFYPWLTGAWQRIMQQLDAGRLPHALLLHGANGLGKHQFALQLAARLLCDQPVAQLACGHCRSCTLFRTGAHPDFLHIQPEEEGKVIKVDMIRSLASFTNLASQYMGRKVVIIEPAESMNRSAFNSLLKTLEEPAGQVILILVSSVPAALPATIKSRCQKLAIQKPDMETVKNWLLQQDPAIGNVDVLYHLACGSPLRALALHTNDLPAVRDLLLGDLESLINRQQDPVSVAANWHKFAEKEPIYWLKAWLDDMVHLKQAPRSSKIMNIDMQERLQALVNQLDLRSIYNYMDYVSESMRTATRIAINPQLMLEDLLIRWSRIKRAS